MMQNKKTTAFLIAFAAAIASSLALADNKAPKAEAILENLVVASGPKQQRPLPRIGVVPSLESNIEDVTLRNVVRRDLDLSGEFRVIPDEQAPEGLYLSTSPVKVAEWKKKGAEAIVKVSGKRLADGKVELRGVAYLTAVGDKPVYEKKFKVASDQTRVESHRIADALIGALTGTSGGFSSEITFTYGVGRQRRVYLMDADGHSPRPVSPPKHHAIASTFGPAHTLYWVASRNKSRYRVYRHGKKKSIKIQPRGSVYGIAWNRKEDRVAISIAKGPRIQLYQGENLANIKLAFATNMALQPAWSPNGRLAVSAAGKWTNQIFVEGKAISPAGLLATAPVFCRNPNGVRAIYVVSAGKHVDLVATGERGGGSVRITGGKGNNNYPACSPDGRLIAFFSTRTSGEGPGLYVMRLDGTRAKRISTLVGDSLSWGRLPAGKYARVPAYKAKSKP